MKYVILENSNIGEVTEETKLDFVGFAKSIHEAEKFIREDAEENFDIDSLHDDFKEYFNRYFICEIIKQIHPVPSVKVNITLKTIKPKDDNK